MERCAGTARQDLQGLQAFADPRPLSGGVFLANPRPLIGVFQRQDPPARHRQSRHGAGVGAPKGSVPRAADPKELIATARGQHVVSSRVLRSRPLQLIRNRPTQTS